MSNYRKLQIFVSSTYLDMREERQAAVQAILQAGHIPAGMELFAAGDKTQLETIRRWIAQSDILLLLLGGRYGSIEPESEKSYTHLEYEYARSLGLPTLAIILKDTFIAEKEKCHADWIEAINIQKLQEFRSMVQSKICSFVDDTREVQLEVLKSLREQDLNEGLIGWIRKDQAVDSNIVRELAILLDENRHLRDQISTISTLSGTQSDTVKSIELLNAYGMKPYNYSTKQFDPYLSFSTWIILIGNQLAKPPYKISNIGAGQAAPQLVAYGLMKTIEEEVKSPMLGTMKNTFFVFTEAGSRVYAELMRRNIK